MTRGDGVRIAASRAGAADDDFDDYIVERPKAKARADGGNGHGSAKALDRVRRRDAKPESTHTVTAPPVAPVAVASPPGRLRRARHRPHRTGPACGASGCAGAGC